MPSKYRPALTLVAPLALGVACQSIAGIEPITLREVDAGAVAPTGGAGGHGGDAGASPASGGSAPASGGEGGESGSSASGAGGEGGEGCPTELASNPKHCGACYHDCLGGACEEGHCQAVVIADHGHNPSHIVVDTDADGWVYWTDFLSVRKVRKSGGGEFPLAQFSAGSQQPRGIALHDDTLYFAVFSNSQNLFVAKVGSDGTGYQPLSSDWFGSWRVAVDENNLYFTNRWDSRLVVQAPLNGDGETVLFDNELPTPTGWEVWDVAVDAENVYFTLMTAAENNPGVYAVPIGGGEPSLLAPAQNVSIGLAVDEAFVYWADLGSWSVYGSGKLLRRKKDLSDEVKTIASGSWATGLVLDGDYIYWGDSNPAPGTGSVHRALKDGSGEPEVLATGFDVVNEVAVDAKAVYFTDQTQLRILKVAK